MVEPQQKQWKQQATLGLRAFFFLFVGWIFASTDITDYGRHGVLQAM